MDETDVLVVVPQQDEVRVWKTAGGDVCLSREPYDWETVDGEVRIRIPAQCLGTLAAALQQMAKDGNG